MEALVLNKSVHGELRALRPLQTLHTITSHARLAGNTSGDDDNLGTLEGLSET